MSKASKRERQRLNREARREAELRALKRHQRLRVARNLAIVLLPVLIVLAVVQVLRSDDDGGSEQARGSVRCNDREPADVPDPAQQFLAPEPQNLDPNTIYTAVLETSCGTIEIQLDQATAPQTVNSFVFLAREGFYNGSEFWRVADSLIQGGDPTGGGDGGPGYAVPDELPVAEPDGLAYPVGSVAMANSGPGTTGSQFFIVTDLNELAAQYSRLGDVTRGQRVVAAMRRRFFDPAQDPADVSTQRPIRPLYVFSVTIEERPRTPDTTAPATTAPADPAATTATVPPPAS